MNAPLLPEILTGARLLDQATLDLATEGIERHIWNSAFGPMLIEVRQGAVFVNGQRVRSIDELRRAVD